MIRVLHENDTYYVEARVKEYTTSNVVYDECYAVINKLTEVVESYQHTLPEAIHMAEHLNMAMVQKSWLWIQSEDEPEEDIDVPMEVVLQ